MKKNNKGLSIVELVIVIAIITIFAGVGLYSISNIPRYRARECSRMISSNLEQTKITSLGKAKSNGDIVWELFRKGNSYYVRYCTDCPYSHNVHDENKISKGRLEVYIEDAYGGQALIDDGKALKMCFNRATGELYSCDATDIINAERMLSTAGSGYELKVAAPTGVRKIIVRGGRWDYVTELVPATGKIIKK